MNLLFAVLALAATEKDYPVYLDKIPIKKTCNTIEFFKECSEISHHRNKDYIVFRWHDEATFCNMGERRNPECNGVAEFKDIMIRKGCLISWCKRKGLAAPEESTERK